MENNIDVFEGFFKNFIKTGILQEEFEIEKDFSIKLKVLNSEETIISESMFLADNPLLNQTGFITFRSAAILAMATVSINGVEIVDSQEKPGRIKDSRYALYGHFLKMPMEVMSKIWDCYEELSNKQKEMYEQDKINDSIKNS